VTAVSQSSFGCHTPGRMELAILSGGLTGAYAT
jgi:hypothetical protein